MHSRLRPVGAHLETSECEVPGNAVEDEVGGVPPKRQWDCLRGISGIDIRAHDGVVMANARACVDAGRGAPLDRVGAELAGATP